MRTKTKNSLLRGMMIADVVVVLAIVLQWIFGWVMPPDVQAAIITVVNWFILMIAGNRSPED